jgi:hypothetical protein
MRYFFSLLMMCGLAYTLIAQPANTTTSPLAVKTESNYKKMDYFHFEASWLTWMNKPDSIKLKGYSHGINCFFAYPMQLGKSKLFFTPGLGITSDNIYLNALPQLDSAKTSMYLKSIKSGISYKNNKQTYAYLTVPVSLNYVSKPDRFSKSFKVSLGMRFGYLVNSHTKYRGSNITTNESEKVKTFNIPFSNKYRFDANFTFGYDWVYVMANYGLNTYITEGKGPKHSSFSVGIGIVGF